MASVESLQELLVDQLRDIYDAEKRHDAEKRLTKALPIAHARLLNQDEVADLGGAK